ncbi:MAG: prepilin peptidase [Acidobacteria bacterium]|nr:prepilin peptidase [Acidobacteriota bacterium]
MGLQMPELTIAFLFGLIVGSFLNVVIVRVPARQSVIFPRSHCPHCSTAIAVYDNIPLLSYFFLGGKCRHCTRPISLRYPVVEFSTGSLFVAAYWKFGLSPALFLNALFFSALLVLIFTDLYHRILPDVITLPLTLLGFSLSYFQDPSIMESQLLENWFDLHSPWRRIASHSAQSLLGILVGAGVLWLVAALYLKLRNIEGMGFGDIKLMAAVGAFLGWSLAWLTIFLGSLLGAIVGSAYMMYRKKGRRYELPFGTFLGAAAIASALWGNDLIRWYAAFYR